MNWKFEKLDQKGKDRVWESIRSQQWDKLDEVLEEYQVIPPSFCKCGAWEKTMHEFVLLAVEMKLL